MTVNEDTGRQSERNETEVNGNKKEKLKNKREKCNGVSEDAIRDTHLRPHPPNTCMLTILLLS